MGRELRQCVLCSSVRKDRDEITSQEDATLNHCFAAGRRPAYQPYAGNSRKIKVTCRHFAHLRVVSTTPGKKIGVRKQSDVGYLREEEMMWMTDYIREIQRQLVEVFNFEARTDVPEGMVIPIAAPDGTYDMTIEGRVDHVVIADGKINCGNFDEEK